MARPSKLTKAILKQSVSYIASHTKVGDAVPTLSGLVYRLGVSRSTLYKWAEENEAFSYTLERIKHDMKYIILVALAFFSTSCFAKDHIIFSCTNKQNKVVEVKSIGNYIQYSFGKKGNPELVFKNTKTQVTQQTKADPSPSTHSEWIVLKNGAFSYLPRTAFGQPDSKGNVESEAGVWIKRNGELLSSEIVCDKSKGKIFTDFEPDLNYMRN